MMPVQLAFAYCWYHEIRLTERNYAKGEAEGSSACKPTFRNNSCKEGNMIMNKYSIQGLNKYPAAGNQEFGN